MPPITRVRRNVDEETAATADQIHAMRTEAERAKANPSRSRGRQMMKVKHAEPDYDTVSGNPEIGERDKLRERILQLSLFPNLYNKLFLQSNS